MAKKQQQLLTQQGLLARIAAERDYYDKSVPLDKDTLWDVLAYLVRNTPELATEVIAVSRRLRSPRHVVGTPNLSIKSFLESPP